jgi:D-3-phosphoglycerate dehydrogenase
MFKYHCLNPIAYVGISRFNENYSLTQDMQEADAILVRSADVHGLKFSENTKVIARAGAGVNNIPLDRCAEEGIVVFNTPGANANGVKELVIAGMLLAARDVVGGINWVNNYKETEDVAIATEKKKKDFAGTELSDKKLGIIGLGAIGVMVANAATHLGMKVYGFDPYMSVDSAWQLSRQIIHAKTMEEVFKECDYITIHVPSNKHTVGMINENSISMMKEGVVILNYARDRKSVV